MCGFDIVALVRPGFDQPVRPKSLCATPQQKDQEQNRNWDPQKPQ
jgi:hypothetical protein